PRRTAGPHAPSNGALDHTDVPKTPQDEFFLHLDHAVKEQIRPRQEICLAIGFDKQECGTDSRCAAAARLDTRRGRRVLSLYARAGRVSPHGFLRGAFGRVARIYESIEGSQEPLVKPLKRDPVLVKKPGNNFIIITIRGA